MRRYVFSLCAITLLWMTGCGESGPRTWVIDPAGGGDYKQIDYALHVAKNGDTLLIKPGTYKESLEITKTVTLRGDGERGEVVILGDKGTAVICRADCSLDNLIINDSTPGRATPVALAVEAGKVNLTRCELYANLRILKLNKLATVDLKDSVLSNCPGIAVICYGTLTVDYCEFKGNTQGAINVESKSPVMIRNSKFDKNGFAVIVGGGSDNVEITGNTISNSSSDGIEVLGSAKVVVRENTITKNTYSGIRFHEKAGGTIEKNTVLDSGENFAGIRTDSTEPTLVKGNTLRGAWKGICAHGPGLTRIEDNDVSASTTIGICIKGKAAVQRCRVYNCKTNGIWALENADATVEESEVFENGMSLCFSGDAQGVIRNSKIHGNAKNRGVLVKDKAVLMLDGNEIYNNGFSGVEATGESNVSVRNNRIYGNKYFGVEIESTKGGSVSNNDLLKNAMGSIHVDTAALPAVLQADNITEYGSGYNVRPNDWFHYRQWFSSEKWSGMVDKRTVILSTKDSELQMADYFPPATKIPPEKYSRSKGAIVGHLYVGENELATEIEKGTEELVISGKKLQCEWRVFELREKDKPIRNVKVWSSLVIPYANYIKREELVNGKMQVTMEPVAFEAAEGHKAPATKP